MKTDTCLICANLFGTKATLASGVDGWGYRIDCPICGRFDLERDAFEDYLDPITSRGKRLKPIQRARIAHKLRTAITSGPAGLPKLTSDFLSRYIKDGCPGPTPTEQTTKTIRLVGEAVSETGEAVARLPQHFFVLIGAPNPAAATDLLNELRNRKLITSNPLAAPATQVAFANINLTLDGWQIFEAEIKGRFGGRYGFLALKFGDAALDAFVNSVLKPTLKSVLSFELVDMRDVSKAGVIDNIMREQIRDASFVIADLTHDNAGAYWEAGYAEGLGKPVIYICEATKFTAKSSHFDTNHCTQ